MSVFATGAFGQVPTVSAGDGTAANPYQLSGGGDITAYIIANQNIDLTDGKNYTVNIPAPAATTVAVAGGTQDTPIASDSPVPSPGNSKIVAGVSPVSATIKTPTGLQKITSPNNPGGYGLYQGPNAFITLNNITLTNNNGNVTSVTNYPTFNTGVNYNTLAPNGGVNRFPTSSYTLFQPGQVFIIYSGVISGTGNVTVTNASGNNSTNPGINNQVNGGVLDIVSTQTLTNPNGAIFTVAPNTTLALTRNGQQGELLTSVGSLPNNQSIVNNGVFYAADEGIGLDNLQRPVTPGNGNTNYPQITGLGITAFGSSVFAVGAVDDGTGTQSIGGILQQFVSQTTVNGQNGSFPSTVEIADPNNPQHKIQQVTFYNNISSTQYTETVENFLGQSVVGPDPRLGQGSYVGPITLANSNPNLSTYNPNIPLLDLEQGDINAGSIINEDVLSPGDTNRSDSFGNINLLEAQYGGGGSVTVAQLNAGFTQTQNGSYYNLTPDPTAQVNFLYPTIINGNLYDESASFLVNGAGGGVTEFVTGSQLLAAPSFLPSGPNNPQVGRIPVIPLEIAQELDYVSSPYSAAQTRNIDVTAGTLLMGNGGAVVDNTVQPNGTNEPTYYVSNNTFLQGNYVNTNLNTGDFFTSNGGGDSTLAFDYGGTYGYNNGLNIFKGIQYKDANGDPVYGVYNYNSTSQPVGNLIVVTPQSGVNHLVLTAPALYQGITDVQPSGILQEGDGTPGSFNLSGITPSTGQTSLFDISGSKNPDGSVNTSSTPIKTPSNLAPGTVAVQTSLGNSIILTAVTGPLVSNDAFYLAKYHVNYFIGDNGLIIMDNTPQADAIILAPNSPGDNLQQVFLMNELDNIVGTGGLEQSGALPLTLEGNTVYSGDTTIDPGTTIYLKSSPLGLGLASGLPNSVVHIGDGATLDASQGDAVQFIGGLSSTALLNHIKLDTYAPEDVNGNNTPVTGATLPDATDPAATIDNATSGTVYIGHSTLHIGNINSNIGDQVFNGIIAPGGDGVTQPLGQVNALSSIGGSIIKDGNFTQTLNGVNTYTGSTTINGGTLKIGATGDISKSSGVFLQPETITTTTLTPTTTTYKGNFATAAEAQAAALADPTIIVSTTPDQVTTTTEDTLGNGVTTPTPADIITTKGTGKNIETVIETTAVSDSQSTSTPTFEVAGQQTIQDFGGTIGTFLNLDSASSLTFGTKNSTEFDGNITGNNTTALTYAGTGTFILGGDNSNYAGTTTINPGGTIGVGSATALGTGNVVNNGTLETALNQHSINVNGNYTQGSTGTLFLNVSGDTAAGVDYEQLKVAGTATLAGNIDINKVGNFVPGQLTLLNLVNAHQIVGSFTTVTSNFATLKFALVPPAPSDLNAALTAPTTPTGIGYVSDPTAPSTSTGSTNLGSQSGANTGAEVGSGELPPANNIIGSNLNLNVSQGTFAVTGLTPNQTIVAQNINILAANPNVQTDPRLSLIVGNLNAVSNNLATYGAALDGLTTLPFETFAQNNSVSLANFSVENLDDYLDARRGENGFTLATPLPQDDPKQHPLRINYGNFQIQQADNDPTLSSIMQRLVAWNPTTTPGLLSDTDSGLFSQVAGTSLPSEQTQEVTADAMPQDRWSTFLQGQVVLAQNFSTPDTAHSDSTTGTVQVGADYVLTPHVLVGALMSYGHTDVTLDGIGSKAKADTYNPGIFASYQNKGWYANGLASYGRNQYTQNRNIQIGTLDTTANSNPSGNQAVGDLDGGYDFHLKNWTVGPTAGAQYVHVERNSYVENGATAGNLDVGQNQSDSLQSRAGLHVEYAVNVKSVTIHPTARVSWQHEYLKQTRGITAQFDGVGAGQFTVTTPSNNPDSALIDLGLNMDLNTQWMLYLDYQLQAGQTNYFAQSVLGGAKYGF